MLLLPTISASGQSQKLKLAGIFGNQMVIQRDSDAPIWGHAKPGVEVTVSPSWTEEVTETISDDKGRWKTTLQTPPAGGPFTISVTAGKEQVQLKNVLSGEVWICSGQSNMQWKLKGFGLNQFKEDVEKAKFPKIRFCNVPQVLALTEQEDLKSGWSTCTPQTALNFSCVAYFFGSRIHQELDVPIGLISTNWGGSSAEAWVSSETLKKDFPDFRKRLNGYSDIIAKSGAKYTRQSKPKGLGQTAPSVLYNSMLKPIIPLKVAGVIWYQGESNVEKPEQYRKLFPALIEDWRNHWGDQNLPFYFVQIAPFKYRDRKGIKPAAYLREAQMMALSVPNTGMAVTMDVGDESNIHPKDKKPVGERLALLALSRTYGKSDIVDSGPLYKDFKIQDDKIRLEFASVGGGLTSRDEKPLIDFTIAGADKKFVPATATIDGDTIIVHSEKVAQPMSVRFGWGNADKPNLMNTEGLPASSFRTDDWPRK